MITLQDLKERPLSYSSLKAFAQSPRHFINYRNKPKESTPALVFGSCLHTMLLEPQTFNDTYVVIPKLDMRTKDGKETYARLEAESVGKTMIQADVHHEVFELAELVKSNPEFAVIMNGATTEVRDNVEIFGLPFIRIKDIVNGSQVIDIKTVQNGQLESIIKDFFNYNYPLQAAIYGGEFSYYVVDKSSGYNGLMNITDDFMEYGKRQLEELCIAFNYCLENPECFNMSYDFWFKFNNKPPVVSLPNWVKLKD